MKKRNIVVKTDYEHISNKLEAKNNLIKHIYDISCLLAGSPDLDEVLEQIVNRAMTGLNFDRAAILLLNQDETKLDCLYERFFGGRETTGSRAAHYAE